MSPAREVEDVEIKVVLCLPHDAASVPVSRQFLDSCLETLGVTRDTRTDIALALSEACANVVLHAEADQQYEVMARASDGRCVIEVANAGNGTAAVAPPTEPVPLTAEHGRGLKIIDAVTDNVRLTGNGRAGTTVHFEKALDWEPGALGEHLSHARDDAAVTRAASAPGGRRSARPRPAGRRNSGRRLPR
jgi:serine/threonine-protein kinase RsbW